VVGIAYASPTDTTLILSGVRQLLDGDEHSITIVLHGFGAEGRRALADSASPAFAAYAISEFDGVSLVPSVTYWTTAAAPGILTLRSLQRDDSLVAGTFAFEARAPGVASRRIAGEFHVKYYVQPVYTLPE
jgi:hypothetical protein